MPVGTLFKDIMAFIGAISVGIAKDAEFVNFSIWQWNSMPAFVRDGEEILV